MPFLSPADLATHLQPELIEEISRGNDTTVQQAIDDAVSEASAYLMKYDTAALFADNSTDAYLKRLIKDIAVWHLLRLATPNTRMEVARAAYEDAINFFKGVMKGQAGPPGWPVITVNVGGGSSGGNGNNASGAYNDYEGAVVAWTSNRKRIQH